MSYKRICLYYYSCPYGYNFGKDDTPEYPLRDFLQPNLSLQNSRSSQRAPTKLLIYDCNTSSNSFV